MGPQGFQPSLTLVNPVVEDAARGGSARLVSQALRDIHDAVQKQHVWQPDGIRHQSTVLEGRPL